MEKYVGVWRYFTRIGGYKSWFFVLSRSMDLPDDFVTNSTFSQDTLSQDEIIRTEVYSVHGGPKIDTTDWSKKKDSSTTQKNYYESSVKKHGTILIIPIMTSFRLEGEVDARPWRNKQKFYAKHNN